MTLVVAPADRWRNRVRPSWTPSLPSWRPTRRSCATSGGPWQVVPVVETEGEGPREGLWTCHDALAHDLRRLVAGGLSHLENRSAPGSGPGDWASEVFNAPRPTPAHGADPPLRLAPNRSAVAEAAVARRISARLPMTEPPLPHPRTNTATAIVRDGRLYGSTAASGVVGVGVRAAASPSSGQDRLPAAPRRSADPGPALRARVRVVRMLRVVGYGRPRTDTRSRPEGVRVPRRKPTGRSRGFEITRAASPGASTTHSHHRRCEVALSKMVRRCSGARVRKPLASRRCREQRVASAHRHRDDASVCSGPEAGHVVTGRRAVDRHDQLPRRAWR